MGWASGSSLAQELYDEIRKHIQPTRREVVAQKFVKHFEHHDADDWDGGSQLFEDAGYTE